PVRPDAKRHDGNHDKKEEGGHAAPAAHTGSEADIAQKQGEEGAAHAETPAPSRNSCARSRPRPRCVAATMIPPPRKCVYIKLCSRSTLALSSATLGSSSSQSGRGTATSRARASRRFCPAER